MRVTAKAVGQELNTIGGIRLMRCVFHALKWLGGSEAELALPPRSPLDHRFRIPPQWLSTLQLVLLLWAPTLLGGTWWWRRRSWN